MKQKLLHLFVTECIRPRVVCLSQRIDAIFSSLGQRGEHSLFVVATHAQRPLPHCNLQASLVLRPFVHKIPNENDLAACAVRAAQVRPASKQSLERVRGREVHRRST